MNGASIVPEGVSVHHVDGHNDQPNGWAESSLAHPNLTGEDPVCVVGMACRLPGDIRSPSDLWNFLLDKKSAQGPIPRGRFNSSGFYSKSKGIAGAMNVNSGYFINEDLREFENSFFGINNLEATYMDPQQRKLLEVVFECFESAGLSMDSVSNSNTGVYVGSFTHDYFLMQMRDPDYLHRYHGTGSGTTLLANRISHVFNLHGPSLAVDTACSSSIHCLHAAVSALKAGECEAAVVAASNLILTPEPFVATEKTGVLSSSGTCQTFDGNADGYGRAEGVNAVYLKRLSAAIRDGDEVSAVIRGTAINSNGRTPGVTLPSAEFQEAVIRKAYAAARIDCLGTDYVECHGTGTAVGDPIEIEALGRCFSSSHRPALLVGSVKSNLGHSEASSGLTSLIKVALAFKHDAIPPMMTPAYLNPKLELDRFRIRIATEVERWPRKHQRRASLNSFGYGGANAHAILESLDSYMDGISNDSKNGEAAPSRGFGAYLALPISAASHKSLQIRSDHILRLTQSCDEASLMRTAFTLASRMPHMDFRTYLLVRSSSSDSQGQWELNTTSEAIVDSRHRPLPFAFIFTGQGAQYAGMARELLRESSVFLDAIRRQDEALRTLPSPYAPDWTLEEVIGQSPERSQIHQPSRSQPLCTAIQIGLVQVLRSWAVKPSAVVGHSSGEIAAAFAADFLSESEAILVAYFRGYTVEQVRTDGAMMATALNHGSAESLINGLGLSERVCVACVNSPESVTLSGLRPFLDVIAEELLATHTFFRFLETGGRAYHSPMLEQVGELYESLLLEFVPFGDKPRTGTKMSSSDVAMYSTIEFNNRESSIVGPSVNMPSYWRANMERPVQFSMAVTELAASQDYHLIEIGPHHALKGPIRQGVASRSLPYSPTLVKNSDSSLRMKELAGRLFQNGYTLDWHNVNLLPKHAQKTTDQIPPYPWDYSNGLCWFESREATDLRNRRYPRHELLGTLQSAGNGIDWHWKNTLRLKEVPWISDHKVGDQVVFPAACYMALAIEAVSQLCNLQLRLPEDLTFEFHNVSLNAALVLSDGGREAEAEIHTNMSPRKLSTKSYSSSFYDFSITSWKSNQAVHHCSGTIRILNSVLSIGSVTIDDSVGYRTWHMNRWYEKSAEEGLVFGPHLRSILALRADAGRERTDSICTMHTKPDALTEASSTYYIHPTVIDSCMQATIVSSAAGNPNMLQGYLPVFLPQCFIQPSAFTGPKSKAFIHVRSQKTGVSTLKANCTVRDADGKPMVDFRGVKLSLYQGGVHKASENDMNLQRHPVMRVYWKPDISQVNAGTQEQLEDYVSAFAAQDANGLDDSRPGSASIAALLDLLGHKNPRMRVLHVQDENQHKTQQYYLDLLDHGSAFPRYGSWNIATIDDTSSYFIPGLDNELFDVIVLERANSAIPWDTFLSDFMPRLSEDAVVIAPASEVALASLQAAGFVIITVKGAEIFARRALTQVSMNKKDVLILIHNPSFSTLEFANVLASHFRDTSALDVRVTTLDELQSSGVTVDTMCISLLEIEHELLASMGKEHMDLISTITATVKDLLWITGSNILADPNPDLTLSNGLSRSLMREQPSLNFTILDVGLVTSMDTAMMKKTCNAALQIMTFSEKIDDKEFVQFNGLLYISRLGPDFCNNGLFRRRLGMEEDLEEVTLDESYPARLAIGSPGITESIYFEQCLEHPDRPPRGFIDVKVQAISLNAKDVYAISGRSETRTGTKSLEFVGFVTAVGPDVTEDMRLGSRVLVCAPSNFSTVERVPAWQAHLLLAEEDSETMATLPIAWGTALYAIRDRARLRAGESILIHSGAGAFGIALISLAQRIGAVVFATAGSDRRREFLVEKMGIPSNHVFSSRDDSFEGEIMTETNGRGVNVVINSLVGDLMHASWRCVSAFGRFLEVGKRELLDAGKLEMDVFARSATFAAFDLTDMLYQEDDYYRDVFKSIVKDVLDLYRSGQIKPAPITRFDVSEVTQAYRYFSSKDRVGKIVISFENPGSRIRVMPPRYSTRFPPQKSYLLVGCLGGLGRSLSTWMKAQGACNLVFLGRSGCDKPEARELVEHLEQSGATVTVICGDVSNASDVNQAVDACKALGPIGGVVHAAMGLHEDLFSRMSNEAWHTSVRPKWRGAWNLHNALLLKDGSPDFFLLTSSMTGTMGVATESNYCAANGFLDAFSYWRRRQGMPTVSIGLGMISEVGYLHENPQIEALLLRRGIQPLNEDEFLQVVDLGISNARGDAEKITATTSHMLTGMETSGVRKLLDQGFDVSHAMMDDQRFSILSAALELDRRGEHQMGSMTMLPGAAKLDWIKGIPEPAAKSLATETSASSLREAVDRIIAKRFSSLILMPYDKIDYSRSFAQLGVDSMIASEFRTWFWNTFKVDIPFLDLLSPDKSLETVSSLVEVKLRGDTADGTQ